MIGKRIPDRSVDFRICFPVGPFEDFDVSAMIHIDILKLDPDVGQPLVGSVDAFLVDFDIKLDTALREPLESDLQEWVILRLRV